MTQASPLHDWVGVWTLLVLLVLSVSGLYLVQPFWMLPILGLFGLRARDVMGYTFLVFIVLTPIVLILVTALGATLAYPL